MSRETLHTLLEELIVSYAAVIEQRSHRQRGGDRRLGTRGGVFRQKITDGAGSPPLSFIDAASAPSTSLPRCFDISRSTLWNAINDVPPTLDAHHATIAPDS